MTGRPINPAGAVDVSTVPARGVVALKRTYIAGPMTGIADLNFPAFHAAAAVQRAAGHDVINPAEINGGANELIECANMDPTQLAMHWQTCMRKDITALMTCDRVVMLDGWTKSRGATLEHHIARALGMEVCEVSGAQP